MQIYRTWSPSRYLAQSWSPCSLAAARATQGWLHFRAPAPLQGDLGLDRKLPAGLRLGPRLSLLRVLQSREGLSAATRSGKSLLRQDLAVPVSRPRLRGWVLVADGTGLHSINFLSLPQSSRFTYKVVENTFSTCLPTIAKITFFVFLASH